MARLLMAFGHWKPKPMYAYLQGLMLTGKHDYLPVMRRGDLQF